MKVLASNTRRATTRTLNRVRAELETRDPKVYDRAIAVIERLDRHIPATSSDKQVVTDFITEISHFYPRPATLNDEPATYAVVYRP